MAFVKIGNVVLNTDRIIAITENHEYINTKYDDYSPFPTGERVVAGIRVITGNEVNDYFLFKDETLDSILEKLKC